ncbi:Uncharacterised protein [Mycobacteroides abscessus subsp. abscessus]|nr:Uncharacterised protein [Mycobacteroides abscessus subsp. abscessus]
MTAWVTCSRCSTSARSPPPNTLGATAIRVAAPPTASSSSNTEASKDGEAKCSTRACGVTRNRSRCSATSAASPAWVTVTPLGVPVEPEV